MATTTKVTIPITIEARDLLIDESAKRRKGGRQDWSFGAIVTDAVYMLLAEAREAKAREAARVLAMMRADAAEIERKAKALPTRVKTILESNSTRDEKYKALMADGNLPMEDLMTALAELKKLDS